MINKKHRLMMFVKAPRPGMVKRRMGSALGWKKSADLYRAFVMDLIACLSPYHEILNIWYYPATALYEVKQWLGSKFPLLPQKGSDLGERMKYGFEYSFSQGATACVLVGSDMPDLPTKYIRKAFDALCHRDAVIGPAGDGGYYLIGFRREGFFTEVFDDLLWSTPTVYEYTVERLRNSGATFSILPKWWDVDTIADLQELLRRAKRRRTTIRHTMAALKELAETD